MEIMGSLFGQLSEIGLRSPAANRLCLVKVLEYASPRSSLVFCEKGSSSSFTCS